MAKTRSRTTNEEIVRHFEARTDALDIAQTTRTPRGQILDWIPRESQTSDGAIASPPPDGAAERGRLGDGERLATFELDHFPAERGPSGTVPVVRKDFDRIQTTKSLGEYLAKQGKRSRAAAASGEAPPDPAPDPFGYYHASSLESATAFGCDTVINVWQPHLENAGDHSISQIGLQNRDPAQLHSVEAGWEVSYDKVRGLESSPLRLLHHQWLHSRMVTTLAVITAMSTDGSRRTTESSLERFIKAPIHTRG